MPIVKHRLIYALRNDSNSNNTLFYVNKEKTTNLLKAVALTLPQGNISIPSGFIRKVTDSGSPVKNKFSNINRKENYIFSLSDSDEMDQFYNDLTGDMAGTESDPFEDFDLYMSELGEPSDKTQTKFSIADTDTGRKAIVIDDDILAGVPEDKFVKTVKNIMLNKFSNGIPLPNDIIYVNSSSRREFVKSNYSKRIKRKNNELYKDKLRTSNNLDEVVTASTNYINEEGNHERKDDIKEFARGKVLLSVLGRNYSAEVIVGIKDNNSMVLHDVYKLKPENFKIRKADTPSSASSPFSSDKNQNEYSGTNEASASKVDDTKNIGKVNNNFENDEFATLLDSIDRPQASDRDFDETFKGDPDYLGTDEFGGPRFSIATGIKNRQKLEDTVNKFEKVAEELNHEGFSRTDVFYNGMRIAHRQTQIHNHIV